MLSLHVPRKGYKKLVLLGITAPDECNSQFTCKVRLTAYGARKSSLL
jgi:hypothetical protein